MKSPFITRVLTTSAFVFGAFALAAVAATWTAPTATPPNGNAEAPINVGGVSQIKTGSLTLNSSLADTIGLSIGNAIKIVDGNQAEGRVLTSDAQGVGTWRALGATNAPYTISGDAVLAGLGNEGDLSGGKGFMKYTLKGSGTLSKLSLHYTQKSVFTEQTAPITSLSCRWADGSRHFYVKLALNGSVFYTSPTTATSIDISAALNKTFVDGDVLTVESYGYCYAVDWLQTMGPFVIYIN